MECRLQCDKIWNQSESNFAGYSFLNVQKLGTLWRGHPTVKTRQDLVQRGNDAGKLQEIRDLEISTLRRREGRFPVPVRGEIGIFIGLQ